VPVPAQFIIQSHTINTTGLGEFTENPGTHVDFGYVDFGYGRLKRGYRNLSMLCYAKFINR